MPHAALLLKPGKERSLARRHPWVYAAAVARIEGGGRDLEPGALVAVRASDRRFLAWAAYSPSSTLRARCWSFDESERIDEAWLCARVARAVARRAHLRAASDALRLVYGEADGLPGFVADQYGDHLVVQIQSAGVDRHREVLIDALCAAAGCGNVFDRSDPALREREGLAGGGGVLRGKAPPALVRVREHGVDFQVDVRRGHKTGFYIDQRDNRHAAAQLVRSLRQRLGRAPRILNCFCYTGGFSIAAAATGAALVDSVDSSPDALALARSNAELNANGADNGTEIRLQWHCADVFEHLRALREQQAHYDLIVLDPPKFATNQHQVERAARAYKDINLSALRVMEHRGWLMTFSCSGAIDADLFQKIVAGAVFDAGVDCFLRGRLGAGADHPVLMTHPEGEYLKGLLLERVD
jgi:23S rRNA (cytosine1962-C5)-methyltransferase